METKDHIQLRKHEINLFPVLIREHFFLFGEELYQKMLIKLNSFQQKPMQHKKEK